MVLVVITNASHTLIFGNLTMIEEGANPPDNSGVRYLVQSQDTMFGNPAPVTMALLSLIGILNAVMMAAPRIIFALGRDGLFTSKAEEVNKGGTPSFALLVTAAIAIILTSVGTFDLLLAIGQFLIVFVMILLVLALFVLRRREPDAPRPYSTWGYPFTPLLMLLFAVLLFIGYCVSNPFPSAVAAVALVLSYPVFLLIKPKK